MSLSVFADRGHAPSADQLREALGESHPSWIRLIDHVRSRRDRLREEWAYPGAKFGWSLRLREGDRNLLYLTPGRGEFLVGVVLGDRAIAAAREAGASAEALALADAAPKYAEGRGIRVSVREPDDLPLAMELAGIKLAR